ncbi:MAG: EamA family transporter [Alphaproteobacteria bacterium]|nr:EamA family transporter [Alphaproteobacteria bacterium]
MSARDLVILLLVVTIWGMNFPVAKLGFTELPPILLTALRFTLVAALLVPFVARPRGRYGQLLLLAVTLGGVHFSLMFLGLSRLDSATVAIASQLTAPFAALLAAIVFRDYLGWRRGLGMAVAFAGVAIMAGEPRIAEDPWPLLAIVGAAFAWAVANIQVKRLGDIDGLVVNGWMAAFAAPQLFAVSWLVEGDRWGEAAQASVAGWGSVAYMAVLVTIVGYGLWYRILRAYPVNLVMPYTLLVPVIGVAAGIGLLGEPLTGPIAVGGIATRLGVAIIVWRRPRLTERQPQP